MQEKEQVLVFPADLINRVDFGPGIITDPLVVAVGYKQIWDTFRASYMDRAEAETNPAFKQVIPYVVLWGEDQDGAYVLAYKRSKAGGEGRLHEKWSVGVGGHINPRDGSGSPTEQDYLSGLTREILEETSFITHYVPPPVALIYDDSNDVGKVHFGVVHIIKANEQDVREVDPAVPKLHWCGRPVLELVKDKMENWSKLVLEHAKLPV